MFSYGLGLCHSHPSRANARRAAHPSLTAPAAPAACDREACRNSTQPSRRSRENADHIVGLMSKPTLPGSSFFPIGEALLI
jgi:hypothetical protein